jgi:hypothetical protein
MSSISHEQAVAEHWDLPNTEIFQSKEVASGLPPYVKPGRGIPHLRFPVLVLNKTSFYRILILNGQFHEFGD